MSPSSGRDMLTFFTACSFYSCAGQGRYSVGFLSSRPTATSSRSLPTSPDIARASPFHAASTAVDSSDASSSSRRSDLSDNPSLGTVLHQRLTQRLKQAQGKPAHPYLT
jgi:hypothetical protein